MKYEIILIKENEKNDDNTKITPNYEYIEREIKEHEYIYIRNYLNRNEDIKIKDPLGE